MLPHCFTCWLVLRTIRDFLRNEEVTRATTSFNLSNGVIWRRRGPMIKTLILAPRGCRFESPFGQCNHFLPWSRGGGLGVGSFGWGYQQYWGPWCYRHVNVNVRSYGSWPKKKKAAFAEFCGYFTTRNWVGGVERSSRSWLSPGRNDPIFRWKNFTFVQEGDVKKSLQHRFLERQQPWKLCPFSCCCGILFVAKDGHSRLHNYRDKKVGNVVILKDIALVCGEWKGRFLLTWY